MTQSIDIRGARTHNLKNISLNIPRDKLVVITGLSGSGKSSLAFDTLYAEGQRRYVESLSSYARQFLSMMDKPDVDYIGGLSPAIAIEQKATSHNPRSTVGTVTEIYDYLRLLYARVGEPRCPTHDITLAAQTVSQMVDQVLALPDETRIMLLAPIIKDKKGEYQQLWLELRAQGFVRAKVNGELIELDNPPKLALRQKHTIEVVVDRLKVKADAKQRLAESIETALKLANGIVKVECLDEAQEQSLLFSAKFACPDCGYSLTELEPRLFSFNSPAGACPACDGLGVMQFFDAERVVYNPKLSLAAGAIRGWDQRNAYYFAMLQGVAAHYQVDIQQPYKNLPKIFQDAVMHGTGDTEILQTFFDSRGKVTERRKAFPGILAIIERRYKDTDSALVREELSKYISMRPCDSCSGARLRVEARHVYVNDLSISALTAKSITEILNICQHLSLSGYRAQVADKIQQELVSRLGFLANVGLNYLTLDRSAETLSGGEAQRIRLASQIGAGLVGVMYVLDEPSIGLHQRDNERLLKTLTHLRDLGNTVLVVEHDEEAILLADHVIDLGPGAGVHGGEIVAQGAPSVIKNNKNSLTGDYLSGRKQIAIPEKRRIADLSRALQLKGAKGHNLKNIDVTIPLGLMTCVTGVSGSGKSTLINDTLYPVAATLLNGAETLSAAPYDVLEGIELLDKVIDIDQSPIGRTPRSNPATYTGLFTDIRSLFAGTQEARSRGYQVGRFSFNVKGGRCEACQGDGVIKVEMHFLPDVYVACDVCQGKRYNRETLDVLYKGKSIHDVLELTIEDALLFFKPIPSLARRLQTLVDVGLGYIKLGQSATTLSGGEAQRVKLAKELSKRDTGNTLYILDEPTTGLHFHDIAQLLTVLNRLRDEGNTVVIIEHNLDVIKTADWIIDLGPEGGSGGGTLLVEGTPEHVATCKKSYTGQFLAPLLRQSRSLKKSAVA